MLYRFSTSNHNHSLQGLHLHQLYYIVSLHQTTTRKSSSSVDRSCIISFLYIKPQLIKIVQYCRLSCIISFLYIKPQHHKVVSHFQCVVLYRFSTSNHNMGQVSSTGYLLYYIVSLHQTTTQSCGRSKNETSFKHGVLSSLSRQGC